MQSHFKLICKYIFFILLLINVIGCQSVNNDKSMNYNNYMDKIRNNSYDDFSIEIRCINKDINRWLKWNCVISSNEYDYSKKNSKLVRNILLQNSNFIGDINNHSVSECGYFVTIELLKKNSTTEKLRIIGSSEGFSFDGYAARIDRLFLNDKLKYWLMKQLKSSGFPQNATMIDKYLPTRPVQKLKFGRRFGRSRPVQKLKSKN